MNVRLWQAGIRYSISAGMIAAMFLSGCGGSTGSLEPAAEAGPPERPASRSAPAASGPEVSAAAPGGPIQLVSLQPESDSKRAAANDNWPGFRGPTGMGTSSAAGLPVTWSSDQNIAWKTPLPGPGASSPIVFGDRIYITCYSGFFVPGQPGGSQEDLMRHLVALDRNSGTILWDRPIPAKLPEEERIRDHGFAASTPAADDDGVYVFFGKSGVFAFDHDGQQLWQADVGTRTHGWGTSASPVLHGDLVLINASVESESLVALDRRTGRPVWTARGINEAWNTPLVAQASSGREEALVATLGNIKAFDPASGDPLWTCKTDITWYMVPSLITHEGVAYSLGGRSGIASLAVRLGGNGDVTATRRLWTSRKGSNVSSPVFHDGHLYWMHDNLGIAYCANPANGEIVYEQRLERGDQVYSSALLADGRLYYLSRGGRTFVLAAKPEFEQIAACDLRDGSMFNGSPAVAGKRLLIRSDKFLYCVGE